MNFNLDAPLIPQCPNPTCTNKNISALATREYSTPLGDVVAFCCQNCKTIIGIVAKAKR